MGDSSSYSSLLALVDDHLSKTKIQGSRSEGVGGIQIPSFSGTQSETRMLSNMQDPRMLPIPSFIVKNSPIANVLAEQVANMLKAKERKQMEEEEKRKMESEMKKMTLHENPNDCVIDLMKALQSPQTTLPVRRKSEVVSSSSSLESLFEPMFIGCDSDELVSASHTPEPLLPCTTDMSYILKQRIKGRAKCSNFGKVLNSRYKQVAAPYLREKVDSNIVRFDFKTKSPCDLIKEKLLWKPVTAADYASQTDVMTEVM